MPASLGPSPLASKARRDYNARSSGKYERTMKSTLLSTALLCASLAVLPQAHAVSAGEIDTFSSGTDGWFAGGGPSGQVPPTPPTVVAGGGPGGAADSFLLLTANGSDGPGGRLVGMNAAQWAGNYTAAGIGAIAMDLRNLGPSDLSVRLYFEDPIPGPPANEALTTFALVLPTGGSWTHAVFPIAASDLTALQGNATTLLANTTVLRIFSGAAADFPPARITGALGVDNIQAIAAVPEPASFALLGAGFGLLALRSRRRAVRG